MPSDRSRRSRQAAASSKGRLSRRPAWCNREECGEAGRCYVPGFGRTAARPPPTFGVARDGAVGPAGRRHGDRPGRLDGKRLGGDELGDRLVRLRVARRVGRYPQEIDTDAEAIEVELREAYLDRQNARPFSDYRSAGLTFAWRATSLARNFAIRSQAAAVHQESSSPALIGRYGADLRTQRCRNTPVSPRIPSRLVARSGDLPQRRDRVPQRTLLGGAVLTCPSSVAQA